MRGTRSALLVAAAMASVGGLGISGAGLGGSASAASQGSPAQANNQGTKPSKGDKRGSIRAMVGSGIGAPWGTNRRAGYGWTNMHQRRVSRKKRNRARNRAAHRG